ncbi:MAG TPA: heat-shock protein Hsp20, partial [Balneolaceae bacterium]|nr:heat-shock protein Hsp20 [Balneolaceae bacterium]
FKLHLNDLVAEDHISAEIKNGLLKLTLPKKSVSEARQIEIK